jgi:hypothetical protein
MPSADEAIDLAARLERINRLTERCPCSGGLGEGSRLPERITREVDAARSSLTPAGV